MKIDRTSKAPEEVSRAKAVRALLQLTGSQESDKSKKTVTESTKIRPAIISLV